MLFQNITSGKRSNPLHFCHRVFKIVITVLTRNIITNKKYVEMTAILTLPCTVKYSTYLRALFLCFHSELPREIDLEERPGGDRAALNLNCTARCT